MNMHTSLTLTTIFGDYAMWTLADAMMICLNSEKPDEYEWALDGLKKLGQLRKKQQDSGYLSEHYKNVLDLLKAISSENRE